MNNNDYEIQQLAKIKDVLTYSQLLNIFNDIISAGKASENSFLFLMGYENLTQYPAIVLTKDFNYLEISAAKECFQLMKKFAQERFQKNADSDNEVSLGKDIIFEVPPLVRLLNSTKEFYNLFYLLQGILSDPNLNSPTDINGDIYAKQWKYIFDLGYRGEASERGIKYDYDFMVKSQRLVESMNLSQESKDLINFESLKSKFDHYYRNNHKDNNSGCLTSIFFIGLVSLSYFLYIIL